MKYIVFLRGINVGGKKIIKMAQLTSLFEDWGYLNVKSYLASGNASFETEENDPQIIAETISTKLKEVLQYDVLVILRTIEQLRELLKLKLKLTISLENTAQIYVSFLTEITKSIPLPYYDPELELRILAITNQDVLSSIVVTAKHNTTDLMKFIEKEFGKKSTTRNWNTILKIVSTNS